MTFSSEGHAAVALIVARAGAAEFSRRVGVSEGMGRHLAAGRKRPGEALQTRIATEWGVKVETWTKTAKRPEGSPAVPVTTPAIAIASPPRRARDHVSGVAELRATIELYDERIALAQSESFTPHAAWVALLRGKADASDKLAKLQGEGEITMAMLVRSKAWREVMLHLRPILERHPDVAAEIAAVLEALEAA